MERKLWLCVLCVAVLCCSCQTSSLVINVVEVVSTHNVTLVCNVSSSTNLTRWTYLSGPTGTSLMSYQNGHCRVSPSDSFLSYSEIYAYTCSNTLYQVTLHPLLGTRNNHILDCRDAVQPDTAGSTWVIKEAQDGKQCNCDSTITFNIRELTEGESVTFICRVSPNVTYVNWNRKFGSNTSTAAMSGQDGQCNTSSGITFLDTSKYFYTCNKTVYQVTKINVRRSEHNDMYMCAPFGQEAGKGSNWILKVKAAVTSVTMTPASLIIYVKENTKTEFTCVTSTARPAATVYWFRHTHGTYTDFARITDNITTTTDYNDLSVTTSILRFVPTRQDNNINVFCKANNSVNTDAVKPRKKRLLNVLCLVDNPMYASSSNVAPVASTSASTSTDIYSKPVKPNKTNAAGNGDIYSVVNKTKGQGKGGKCKSTNEKGKQKEGEVYENVELENNPNKKDAGKQLPPKPPAEQPKLKIVNQDGLIYADLIFKDKPPGEKMVILGDDPTPYDLVDFTKKADPLPESDEEEQK